MSKEGRTGVSENTPKNILFGAGTIHKGLKYTTNAWNFADTIVGATSGGSKLSIIPEVTQVEVDGVLVKAKGLNVKTGTLGATGTSDDTTYNAIVSKADISTGDYWENIAFVGKTLDGKNIIAILENALCTSGFEQEGKNKEGAVGKYTFECHADLDGDMNTLPWKIYYPKNA